MLAAVWVVPSQTAGERTYRVSVVCQTCTCPDHTEAGNKCKHIYAAEFTQRRDVAPDGTVTETKTITFTWLAGETLDIPAGAYDVFGWVNDPVHRSAPARITVL